MNFNVLINGPDAILNQTQETNILLFPIPAKNEITVTTNDDSNPIKNVVFNDVNGKNMYVEKIQSAYSLINLAAGFYFIEIELQNGDFVMKKLLKL